MLKKYSICVTVSNFLLYLNEDVNAELDVENVKSILVPILMVSGGKQLQLQLSFSPYI